MSINAELRMRRRKRFALCLSLALPASGCAVGPDFTSPPAPEVDRFTPEKVNAITGAGTTQVLDYGASIPERWWSVFGNAELDRLVQSAIEHNPTIPAAEAAIKMAFYNAEAQKGAFLPQLSANVNGSRNLVSNNASVSSILQQNVLQNLFNPSPNITNFNTPFYLALAQFQVSYTADIWGQNRRSAESLEAQTDQQRYQLEAAYLALTSNVVNAAIQDATVRGQMQATERVIKIERDLLDLARANYEKGVASKADFLAQQAALAQAMELLPPLQKQLAQGRDLLTALAGQYSTAEVREKFHLRSLKLPQKLPVSLPSTLVRQRPDIRAAEANLHSTSAQIGVAIAARLPAVTLSGTRGWSAFKIAELFLPGTGLYTFAANAAQPLFDGFTLLNKQKAAEAAFEQAEAQYRSAVVTAFQNVADALRALQADSKAVQAARFAERTAKDSLDIVVAQAKAGQVSQLAILNAQQTYLAASITAVQAEGARLADVAGLFMALGGSWKDQNLKDLPRNGEEATAPPPAGPVAAPVNESLLPSAPL